MREAGETAMFSPFRCGGTHPCSKRTSGPYFLNSQLDSPWFLDYAAIGFLRGFAYLLFFFLERKVEERFDP
jgi:hypothetical protein